MTDLTEPLEIPPHGYVRYVDHLGSDMRVVEAARVSYMGASKGPEKDRKLLNYMLQHRHTSPFEQCSITFNIKMPIFVMRQFVRHRMFRLNEESARYTELQSEFFLPDVWRVQDTKNKQGGLIDPAKGDVWNDENTMLASELHLQCHNTYKLLLQRGVAREQARMVLPVSIYTEIYVSCDLHNLMHFLRLRMDSHAQKEIQDVANAMHCIAVYLFPWTMDAFRRFQLKVVDQNE